MTSNWDYREPPKTNGSDEDETTGAFRSGSFSEWEQSLPGADADQEQARTDSPGSTGAAGGDYNWDGTATTDDTTTRNTFYNSQSTRDSSRSRSPAGAKRPHVDFDETSTRDRDTSDRSRNDDTLDQMAKLKAKISIQAMEMRVMKQAQERLSEQNELLYQKQNQHQLKSREVLNLAIRILSMQILRVLKTKS